MNEAKTIVVEIEKGTSNGDKLVFEREAEQIPDMIPGDLIFTIK